VKIQMADSIGGDYVGDATKEGLRVHNADQEHARFKEVPSLSDFALEEPWTKTNKIPDRHSVCETVVFT
jgi:hypothetical protein